MFDHVPHGCKLELVTNDDSSPHLRVGEFAVIDTSDIEPQHGEVYLVKRSSGGTAREQLLARRHTCGDRSYVGFWTRCLNFGTIPRATRQDLDCLSSIDGGRAARG